MGTVELEVCVGTDVFLTMTFYVVPRGAMRYDAILGMSALEFMNVDITTRGIDIKRKMVENDMAVDEDLLYVWNVYEQERIDVEPRYRSTIEDIVAKYQPKTDVRSRVETKIILTDEEPVHAIPKRLAPKEKKGFGRNHR